MAKNLKEFHKQWITLNYIYEKGHPNFYLYDRQIRHFHTCSNNNDDDNREKVNQ